MSRYEILDLQHCLYQILDEEAADKMIKAVAKEFFSQHLKDVHENLMTMNLKELPRSTYTLKTLFGYIASQQMRSIGIQLYSASKEKNQQKMVETYLIVLEKCEILKRELEDYVKEPLLGMDIEKFQIEVKEKFGIDEIGRAKWKNASCSDCNVF